MDSRYLKPGRPIKNTLERLLVVWPLNLIRWLLHRCSPSLPIKPGRVLIIRHNQLGDAVASSALVQALREHFPTAAIDVLASAYNREVFTWIPGLNQVIVRPTGFIRRFRLLLQLRGRYDLVFQTLFEEHYLQRTVAARLVAWRGVLIGHARQTPLQSLMDHAVYLPSGLYPVKLLALLQPLGAPSPTHLAARFPRHSLSLPAAAQDVARQKLAAMNLMPGEFIALNISARLAERSLGDIQAGDIARAILAAGRQVLVVAAPGQEDRVDAVLRAAPGSASLAFGSFPEAMAAVGLAALHVGPDTGTVHFAAAAGVPCVVVFSARASPDVWSPYGVPFVSLQAQAGQQVSDIAAAKILQAVAQLDSQTNRCRPCLA